MPILRPFRPRSSNPASLLAATRATMCSILFLDPGRLAWFATAIGATSSGSSFIRIICPLLHAVSMPPELLMPINIPRPDLQVCFAASLSRRRETCLLQSLRQTAGEVNIAALDAEPGRVAPKTGLARLATGGLRGETALGTPLILQHNPALLGYYRLLLGFSQKAFFIAAWPVADLRHGWETSIEEAMIRTGVDA